jgi:hypothetical protein
MRSNRPLLERIARTLEPILPELVFVGGIEIGEDLRIRLVSPPMFLATKLAAFEGRGGDDLMRSHDIEDILAVVAYREELPGEVRAEAEAPREWIRQRIATHLVQHPDAEYVVAGNLPGARAVPGLVPRVLERLSALAAG